MNEHDEQILGRLIHALQPMTLLIALLIVLSNLSCMSVEPQGRITPERVFRIDFPTMTVNLQDSTSPNPTDYHGLELRLQTLVDVEPIQGESGGFHGKGGAHSIYQLKGGKETRQLHIAPVFLTSKPGRECEIQVVAEWHAHESNMNLGWRGARIDHPGKSIRLIDGQMETFILSGELVVNSSTPPQTIEICLTAKVRAVEDHSIVQSGTLIIDKIGILATAGNSDSKSASLRYRVRHGESVSKEMYWVGNAIRSQNMTGRLSSEARVIVAKDIEEPIKLTLGGEDAALKVSGAAKVGTEWSPIVSTCSPFSLFSPNVLVSPSHLCMERGSSGFIPFVTMEENYGGTSEGSLNGYLVYRIE